MENNFVTVNGDCLEVMESLEENIFDTCITDPPYHLESITKRFGKTGSAPAQYGKDGAFSRVSRGFMGKEWDGGDISFNLETWKKIYRVLKPGATLLCFGGTRTYHRIAVAIEDAGFILRDTIMWVYGQGFAKSHNMADYTKDPDWDGWGTMLKPAYEPIIVAQKPVEGTYGKNAEKWGVAGFWIDGARIPGEEIRINKLEKWSGFGEEKKPDYETSINDKGRFPSNFIHDGSEEVLNLFPYTKSGNGKHTPIKRTKNTEGPVNINMGAGEGFRYADEGSAARFFYCAKASTSERHDGLGEGGNVHPTVKPLALMRYLARLTKTPQGGIVFDPFMGSGTTGLGAMAEGRQFFGIEREKEYYDIANRRLAGEEENNGRE